MHFASTGFSIWIDAIGVTIETSKRAKDPARIGPKGAAWGRANNIHPARHQESWFVMLSGLMDHHMLALGPHRTILVK